MFRRIAVISSLAVIAAMFVGSSTASAAAGDAGVCVFTGLAGNLTDSQNGTAGIPSAQKDFGDGSLHDVETGTYQYGGPAFCAGRFNGATVNPTSAAPNATITSNGQYHNVVCGTGYASDPTGANTVVTDGTNTITGVGYEIPFIAGNGPLHIGTGLPSTNPFDAPSTTISGGYVGSGAVHIQPRSPANCVTTDTPAFDVTGGFVAVGK